MAPQPDTDRALVIAADVLVAGGAVRRPGWLRVEAGIVTEAGSGQPPVSHTGERIDLGHCLAVPGFVDMHVHGGGGGAFTSAAPEQIRAAIALHRAHGTTLMNASLVSAAPDVLLAQVRVLADLVEAGELAGIHLEGPWLAPEQLGAHDITALRAPDLLEVRRLLHAARGTIRMATLAPELPGALAAIELLREHGVVAAAGHTNATYDQTRAAIRAGVSVGTHLFNAMRPIRHREPGPVIALIEAPDVVVEVIADGVHLHPTMYERVRDWVGPHRLALVTDAMAAAGMPDGEYALGTLAVTVTGGVAQLSDGRSIAGGTATSDRLFRTAAGAPTELDDDRLLAAVQQTSATPLRALGMPPRDLSVGAPADLVVLTPDLSVVRVLVGGRWVADGPASPRDTMGV